MLLMVKSKNNTWETRDLPLPSSLKPESRVKCFASRSNLRVAGFEAVGFSEYTKMPLMYSKDNGATWIFSDQDQPLIGARAQVSINGIACSTTGTRWSAVGDLCYVSDNGINWTTLAPENSIYLAPSPFDVEFGNGVFVCITNNTIQRSTDAENWVNVHTHGGEVLLRAKVAYGNGIWVAAGTHTFGEGQEAIHHSTDNGQTWSRQTAPPGFLGHCNDVAFGQNKFVVVGGGDPSGNTPGSKAIAAVSTNGVTWSPVTSPWRDKDILTTVAYNSFSGEWLTIANPGGVAYKSTDAINWTQVTSIGVDLSNARCLIPVP